jgi:DNA (cytosine-5)-methyltransferase 1
MIGIDLFCGAGGLSLGAVQAGINLRLAIDLDPHAITTYRLNHKKTASLAVDIRCIRNINIPCQNEQKIIIGGPPCQGFSTSNQRTRSSDNPANWLFLEFMRIVKIWKPQWVVLENVKGILETEDGIFSQYISEHLEKLGYSVSCWLLNAADYGVPQVRSRFFFIGSIDGISPRIPTARKKHTTVQESISDLPLLENGASENVLPYRSEAKSTYAKTLRGGLQKSPNHLVTMNAPYIIERYKHIPSGGNWLNIPSRLMNNYSDRTKCHTGIYRRLHANAPSVVIGNYRKNMLIHPTQDRGLSVREAARLQSFPDWYEFKGTIGFQQQQVGNAVPPMMARAVFEAIVATESGKQNFNDDVLPDTKKELPRVGRKTN